MPSLSRLVITAAAVMLGGPALAQSQAPLAAYSCGGCHGVGSQGAGAVAALAGRPEAEIVAAMHAFRSGERQGTIMGRIARGYSDEEIVAIARAIASWR